MSDDIVWDTHRRIISIVCDTCGSPYDEGHGVEDCLAYKDAEIERLRGLLREVGDYIDPRVRRYSDLRLRIHEALGDETT